MKSTFTLALVLAAGTAFAGSGLSATASKEVQKEEKDESVYDRIWGYPTLYKNDNASFLNELRIVGRAHFDVFSLDSGLGADADWIVRRLRVGIKARFFHNLDLHVETELDPQNDNPAYRRLTDAYLSWKFNDAVRLTVGKQSVKFTLDGATSSNELLTLERNNLSNNIWFTQEYISGVGVSGKIKGFQYNTGFFSGGTDTAEFGNFDEGHFFLASVGYDFAAELNAKKALLRADYVYNDRNLESNAARPFEHIGSLNFNYAQERWGVGADVSYATGYGTQSDLFGFVVMPWFNITKELQAVVRYTYLDSDGNDGIRLNRYENVMTAAKGDEYQDVYVGLNYYLYGHKLKLQTGWTYAVMKDAANNGGKYDGWAWTTGLRISW